MLIIKLYVSFLCLKVGILLVPEVSQEGLLQPYLTYSDVSLFHYHVPPEVDRVTWEFAAFMDDPNCPIRDVHVLVQHGSYPVFSTYNDTFPSYMYNFRSSLQKVVTKTAYQPHDATLLSIYNPLPGSWFAAAYIPNWNEQMQQEGLIHKCRYSLGSVAMWSQKDLISTLNIGLPQRISTTENLSYYRFYVPSHTWLLLVNISECHIREKFSSINDGTEGPRWCIRSAALSARALPNHQPDIVGAANISHGGGHVFTEKHPYSDSYYYLLIFTEGETDLTVAIKTKECGSIPKRPYSTLLKSARNTLQEGVSADLSDGGPSVAYIVNSSDAQLDLIAENGTTIRLASSSSSSGLNSSLEVTEEEAEDEVGPEEGSLEANKSTEEIEHECFPILPLARIKHSRDFTETFLIQGPEWFSTWVSVHGKRPVFTHMTLLPYTDIGGTLSITLHMDELLLNVTNQLISVIGCVKKGRPPLVSSDQLECDQDLTLNISTASLKTVEDFLLIPFPEPDVWYLALHVVCYHKGERVPCVISHVMVSIDVRTQPCVYAGEAPCGTHGVCQETHRGMFFFSSCICQEGWRGWGCHNGQHAQGWPSFLSGVCLLTVSNVFFLPPILLAAKRQFYPQALLFSATMVASVLYHACDSEVFSYCVTRYEVLQFTDFFFSLLCFWITIVNLCGFHSDREMTLLHLLGVVLIAPAVQYSRTALLSFIFPIGVAVIITISKILYGRFCYQKWPAISPQRFLIRCLGVVVAVSGLFLFALIQTKDNYKYVHSAWHAMIALSLLFLLPSKRPPTGGCTLLSPPVCGRRCFVSAMSSPHANPHSRDEDDALIDLEEEVGTTDSMLTACSPVFRAIAPEEGRILSRIPQEADVDLIVFGAADGEDGDSALCLTDDGKM